MADETELHLRGFDETKDALQEAARGVVEFYSKQRYALFSHTEFWKRLAEDQKKAQEEAQKSTRKTSEELNLLGKQIEEVKRKIGEAFGIIAIEEFTRRSIMSFASLDRAMRGTAQITGETEQQMSRAKDRLYEIEKATGQSAEKMANYRRDFRGQLLNLGEGADELFAPVAKAAAAVGTQTSNMSVATVAALNNMKIPAKEFEEVLREWSGMLPGVASGFGHAFGEISRNLETFGIGNAKTAEQIAANIELLTPKFDNATQAANVTNAAIDHILNVPQLQSGLQQISAHHGNFVDILRMNDKLLSDWGAFGADPSVLRRVLGGDKDLTIYFQWVHEHLDDIAKEQEKAAASGESIADRLAKANGKPTAAINELVGSVHALRDAIGDVAAVAATPLFENLTKQIEHLTDVIQKKVPPGPPPRTSTSIRGFQTGGVINQPTLGMVGEGGPEAVIPMADLQRARERDQAEQQRSQNEQQQKEQQEAATTSRLHQLVTAAKPSTPFHDWDDLRKRADDVAAGGGGGGGGTSGGGGASGSWSGASPGGRGRGSGPGGGIDGTDSTSGTNAPDPNSTFFASAPGEGGKPVAGAGNPLFTMVNPNTGGPIDIGVLQQAAAIVGNSDKAAAQQNVYKFIHDQGMTYTSGEDCAEFVTAVLSKSEGLPKGTLPAGVGKDYPAAASYLHYGTAVDAAHAQPGDVLARLDGHHAMIVGPNGYDPKTHILDVLSANYDRRIPMPVDANGNIHGYRIGHLDMPKKETGGGWSPGKGQFEGFETNNIPPPPPTMTVAAVAGASAPGASASVGGEQEYPGVPKALSQWVALKENFTAHSFGDYGQTNIGYGTAAHGRTTIDEPTARREMNSELAGSLQRIDAINPNIPPGIRMALASLDYNTGWTSKAKEKNSALRDAIARGDWATARTMFASYTHAGGTVLQGLVNRRNQELNALWDNQQYTFDRSKVTSASQDFGGAQDPRADVAVAKPADVPPPKPAAAKPSVTPSDAAKPATDAVAQATATKPATDTAADAAADPSKAAPADQPSTPPPPVKKPSARPARSAGAAAAIHARHTRKMQEGGVVTEPTQVMLGEKGREAVVPLGSPMGESMPLGQAETPSALQSYLQRTQLLSNPATDVAREVAAAGKKTGTETQAGVGSYIEKALAIPGALVHTTLGRVYSGLTGMPRDVANRATDIATIAGGAETKPTQLAATLEILSGKQLTPAAAATVDLAVNAPRAAIKTGSAAKTIGTGDAAAEEAGRRATSLNPLEDIREIFQKPIRPEIEAPRPPSMTRLMAARRRASRQQDYWQSNSVTRHHRYHAHADTGPT